MAWKLLRYAEYDVLGERTACVQISPTIFNALTQQNKGKVGCVVRTFTMHFLV
jgi:hypothetical protein